MSESLFEIHTIDPKIINIDGSYELELRSKTPLKLADAAAVAIKYGAKGHIVEYRKVS
jgi:hypothetical protein